MMLIIIPIGPLLSFDDGLNPRIGSVLTANSPSISPNDFIRLKKNAYLMVIVPFFLVRGNVIETATEKPGIWPWLMARRRVLGGRTNSPSFR